jgi:hypothetical protein
VVWTGLIWLKIGLVEGSCEHGEETSGSIKCWEMHEYLSTWQLLKDSAPWSWLVNIPVMIVTIQFGMGEKTPLEHHDSLIHYYTNNPNNPALFIHMQFLVPEVVSTTINNAPETATDAYMPLSTFLCPTLFRFCEKLGSNDKLLNLYKIF